MKKTVVYWQIGGFLFTAILGTLLHFLFEWTGENRVAAVFSAVNESIWEHLKLLFYPMVVVSVVEYFRWGSQVDSFWWVKLMGIVIGLTLIPVIYYTYTGMLGVKADWFNIAIFFLAAAVVYWAETKLFDRRFACGADSGIAIGLICLIGIAFTVLTFAPPHIPFFRDPLTGTYGFQKK